MVDQNESLKKFLAGLFFVVGIVLIIFVTLMLGRARGFAQKKFQVVVLFKDVGGLSEGAPVRLSGVNVGNVSLIEFLDTEIQQRRVKVVLNILKKFKKQLDTNASFTIRTEGLLGEKLIEINVGQASQRIDLAHPNIGIDPINVSDLAQVFTGAAESFTKTASEMSRIDMVELAEVMRDSSKALLITSRGLNEIMDELQDIAHKSKRLIDRIEQRVIEGDLFKVF